MTLVIKLFIQIVAILVAAYILAGVEVDSFFTTLVVAIILGVVNSFIKPILIFLTLPITLLTFGLFVFVINAFLVMLVSFLVPGFHVDGFLWALLFSIVVSLISAFLEKLSK